MPFKLLSMLEKMKEDIWNANLVRRSKSWNIISEFSVGIWQEHFKYFQRLWCMFHFRKKTNPAAENI